MGFSPTGFPVVIAVCVCVVYAACLRSLGCLGLLMFALGCFGCCFMLVLDLALRDGFGVWMVDCLRVFDVCVFSLRVLLFRGWVYCIVVSTCIGGVDLVFCFSCDCFDCFSVSDDLGLFCY